MTVYIEYVLIDNFVIDYLLLKTTFSLARAKVKRGRLAVCATLGAAISLFYPLIEGVLAVSIPLKFCVGLLLVSLARKHQSLKLGKNLYGICNCTKISCVCRAVNDSRNESFDIKHV